MIHCLYYGAYANYDATIDSEDYKSAHQLHAVMYALADQYDLTLLRDTAQNNFKNLATGQPQELLRLIGSIPIVYSSTPDSDRGLRGAVVGKVKASPSDLLHKDVKASFQKVLIEVPEFSWDLHQHWIAVA